MKKCFTLILIAGLFQSCMTTSAPESEKEKILLVENGLGGPVFIEGDSTWAIESRMAYYGVPGLSIAVIKDGKIAWMKGYGVMNKGTNDSVRTQTLFQAGSISKPVAAYGALHLVDQGKINLDSNVNVYLKSWKLPENEFTAKKKVMLKHILSHTGGLTVHGFLGYSSDLTVPTLIQILDGVPPANSPAIRVDKVPGESFRYSGGGYTVMQQMLIDVEGKSFPMIMKENVLEPLGMTHSTYDQPLPADQTKLAASGYLPNGTMTKGGYHTYPEMAAAGLWTTSEDLAKFAINVQETVQGKSTTILSKAMIDKMLTPFVSDDEGLGLFIMKKNNEVYFGHNGWDEGFSSEMIAHRDKGYGVVVLTNSNHPELISEVINAVARIYDWADYIKRFPKVNMDTTVLALIAGRYYNGSDGMIRIYNTNSRLFLKYIRSEQSLELFRITDSTYISHNGGLPVQFKRNPIDGKMNLVFVEEQKPISFVHPQVSEETKVPYEYLLEGKFELAKIGYRALLKANPKDGAINEKNLSSQGYNLMSKKKYQLAKDILNMNMILYPKSANTYDSYAEACMNLGMIDEAVLNYKKSLAIDPTNKKAEEKLKVLKKI